jgi:hypothetical protein
LFLPFIASNNDLNELFEGATPYSESLSQAKILEGRVFATSRVLQALLTAADLHHEH